MKLTNQIDNLINRLVNDLTFNKIKIYERNHQTIAALLTLFSSTTALGALSLKSSLASFFLIMISSFSVLANSLFNLLNSASISINPSIGT